MLLDEAISMVALHELFLPILFSPDPTNVRELEVMFLRFQAVVY